MSAVLRRTPSSRRGTDAAGWDTTHQAVAAATAPVLGVRDPIEPAGPIDWPGFSRLLDRHRVAPLVHRTGWLAAQGAPDDLVDAVDRASRQAQITALAQIGLLRDMLAAFRREGIAVIVLKGLPVAQWGYGDLAARHAIDIDILVPPERAVDAIAVLGALGPSSPASAGHLPVDEVRRMLDDLERYPFLHEVDVVIGRIAVDLHWRLTENPALMPVDPRWLSAPASMEVAGIDVPTLPPEEAFWYLLVHGTKHGWRRLKWLADVVAVAVGHPELCAPSSLQRAADHGMDRCVATGLQLAEIVFGPFLPDESRRYLAGTPGSARLVRGSLRELASDESTFISVAQLPGYVGFTLRFRSDARYRTTEAKRLLIRAGLLRTIADPNPMQLAGAPLRWLGRKGRRTLVQLRPGAR